MTPRARMIRWLLLLALSLVLLVFVIQQRQQRSADKDQEAVSVIASNSVALPALPRFVTGLESLPHSLQGADVPDGLQMDASGQLILSRALRDLFDFFLSAQGEEPIRVILTRIQAYIRNHHLSPQAETQALHILDEYVAYKKATQNLPDSSTGPHPDLAILRGRMNALQSLRKQYFEPDVLQAFFGEQEVYDQYTLTRMQIMQDNHLSPEAKASALSEALDTLPMQLRQSMQPQIQYESLQALTQDWKKRHGSAAQLRQIRENLVGAAAADRLDALDQAQSQFDGKVQQFMQQRTALMNNASLSPDERQNQVDQLRSSMFTAQEQIRVHAMEQEKATAPAASGAGAL